MNIQVRHISTTMMNALGTNHDETNLNSFCAVPCKGSMRKFEQDAGGGSNLSVLNSLSDFLDPWQLFLACRVLAI